MSTNILDYRVYRLIFILDSAWEKVSVRKIAKVLGKENSLYSIQLSLSRLLDRWMIIKNEKWKVKLDCKYNLKQLKNEFKNLHKKKS